jgi:hypothetical protein
MLYRFLLARTLPKPPFGVMAMDPSKKGIFLLHTFQTESIYSASRKLHHMVALSNDCQFFSLDINAYNLILFLRIGRNASPSLMAMLHLKYREKSLIWIDISNSIVILDD